MPNLIGDNFFILEFLGGADDFLGSIDDSVRALSTLRLPILTDSFGPVGNDGFSSCNAFVIAAFLEEIGGNLALLPKRKFVVSEYGTVAFERTSSHVLIMVNLTARFQRIQYGSTGEV